MTSLERGQQKQLQCVFGGVGFVLGLRVLGRVVRFWHCWKTGWMIALSLAVARASAAGAAVQLA